MKLNFTRLFIFSLFLCLFPSGAHSQISGTWKGTAQQLNPDMSYPMKLRLSGFKGSADYPSLGCGGTLDFLRYEGEASVYREHLTYGKTKCIDGGIVTVEPQESSVLWKWSDGKTSASASLMPAAK